MFLDVESLKTLNAMHRTDILQEVKGDYRVRQPWAERVGAPPFHPLRQPLQVLRAAIAHLHPPVPLTQPSR